MKILLPTLLAFFVIFHSYAQNQDSTAQVVGEPNNAEELEGLASDRPGASLNPLTLQKGLWQIQFGINGGESYDTEFQRDYSTGGIPLDIRYGITNRLEIMVSGNPLFAAPVGSGGGIDYAALAVGGALRYNLVQNSQAGSVAVYGSYTHVNYEGIEKENVLSLKAIYSIPIGKVLSFTTNLGYSFYSFDADGLDYTFNLGINIMPRLGLFFETYGAIPNNGSANQISQNWIDGGLFFLVNPNFQLDILYAQGTFNDFRDFFASIGLTYRFGTLK